MYLRIQCPTATTWLGEVVAVGHKKTVIFA